MAKQFQPVNCSRGAPMGRHEFGQAQDCEPRTVRLFRVNLDSGGYDDGGAYWGLSSRGESLFCATDGGDYRRFVRSQSRLSAVADLEIPRQKLKAPPMAAFRRLRALEARGVISAGGVLLRQRLNDLDFLE